MPLDIYRTSGQTLGLCDQTFAEERLWQTFLGAAVERVLSESIEAPPDVSPAKHQRERDQLKQRHKTQG
ncbi:MAG: hypothetical protein KF752_08330 [Pirellulaceae bacterium]|nr:hypothetical protein [Pirellulaceae bacterium]